jgi:hypothetical protein
MIHERPLLFSSVDLDTEKEHVLLFKTLAPRMGNASQEERRCSPANQ